MIIGRRHIKKLRKPRDCCFCKIPIHGEAIRLFGAAETRDQKHNIFYHPTCERLERNGYTAEQLDADNPHTQHERD